MNNKYQEALDKIKNLVTQKLLPHCSITGPIRDLFADEINTLQELVSNEPLKLEEIKKGDWIWDNKLRNYFKVNLIYKSTLTTAQGWTVIFEEGRLFPREVKE